MNAKELKALKCTNISPVNGSFLSQPNELDRSEPKTTL